MSWYVFFVDDPENFQQSSKVRKISNDYKTVYVIQIVQVETVWVLSRAYGFSRDDIRLVLENLLNNQAIRLENEMLFTVALQLYSSSNIDFSDALILQNSLNQKITVVEF